MIESSETGKRRYFLMYAIVATGGKQLKVEEGQIVKVEKFKKEFPEKAKEAAKNFLKNLVDKLKEIPPKMLEIGKNIIDGIIDGMSNAIKNAKQADIKVANAKKTSVSTRATRISN